MYFRVGTTRLTPPPHIYPSPSPRRDEVIETTNTTIFPHVNSTAGATLTSHSVHPPKPPWFSRIFSPPPSWWGSFPCPTCPSQASHSPHSGRGGGTTKRRGGPCLPSPCRDVTRYTTMTFPTYLPLIPFSSQHIHTHHRHTHTHMLTRPAAGVSVGMMLV